MKREHLPVGDFLLVEVPLEQVLNTPTDFPIGYILELYLTYPHNIRDLHRDFPLAPTKEIVPDEWLSTYQRELKFNVNMPRSYVPKLLQTVTDKKLLHAPLQESSALCITWSDCRKITSRSPIFERKLDGAIY